MVSEKHELVLQWFMDQHPTAKRKGFGKALRKAMDYEDFGRIDVVPDAWFEKPIKKEGWPPDFVAVEVVTTNDISDLKMERYASLWGDLDFYDVGLELWAVYGCRSIVGIPLEPYYFHYVISPGKYESVEHCIRAMEDDLKIWNGLSGEERQAIIQRAGDILGNVLMGR